MFSLLGDKWMRLSTN